MAEYHASMEFVFGDGGSGDPALTALTPLGNTFKAFQDVLTGNDAVGARLQQDYQWALQKAGANNEYSGPNGYSIPAEMEGSFRSKWNENSGMTGMLIPAQMEG